MALSFELDLGSLSLGKTSKPWFLEEFGFLSMNLFYGIGINICFLSEANIAMQFLWLPMRKLASRKRNGGLLLFKILTFLLSRYNEFEVLWRFMSKEKGQNCLCWTLLHHKFLKEGAVSSLQKCPDPMPPRHVGSFSSSNRACLFSLRVFALARPALFQSLILIIQISAQISCPLRLPWFPNLKRLCFII